MAWLGRIEGSSAVFNPQRRLTNAGTGTGDIGKLLTNLMFQVPFTVDITRPVAITRASGRQGVTTSRTARFA